MVTVTADIIANRRGLSWQICERLRSVNYDGSVIMVPNMKLSTDAETLKDVHIPFHDVLPIVHSSK